MATWNETVTKFTRVVDGLGKEIDAGILETVVALNMHGIATRASCEGHLNWGVPHPWIEIEAELAQKYQLHLYLVQFYEKRAINFETMLIFHGYRMRSQGAVFAPLLSRAEQEQKLHLYQAEMAEFTVFLKSQLRL